MLIRIMHLNTTCSPARALRHPDNGAVGLAPCERDELGSVLGPALPDQVLQQSASERPSGSQRPGAREVPAAALDEPPHATVAGNAATALETPSVVLVEDVGRQALPFEAVERLTVRPDDLLDDRGNDFPCERAAHGLRRAVRASMGLTARYLCDGWLLALVATGLAHSRTSVINVDPSLRAIFAGCTRSP
jgi:hypothetical protein